MYAMLFIVLFAISGCAATFIFDPSGPTRNQQLMKQQQDDHAILGNVVAYVNQQITSQQQAEAKVKKSD
jgi:hypothetical protein